MYVEEIKSLEKLHTLELVDLPVGAKLVGLNGFLKSGEILMGV